MSDYPRIIPGQVIVRDDRGVFIRQAPLNDVIPDLLSGKINDDFEIKTEDDGLWIPFRDLGVTDEDEARARAAVSRTNPNRVLHEAAAAGDYELIKWSLQLGADIETHGKAALLVAIQGRHAICVRLLINRGARFADLDVIKAAASTGDESIFQSLNPKKDHRVSSTIRSMAQDLMALKESSKKVQDINEQIQGLERKASAIATRPGMHVPKCPTCGSPDVLKIALLSKGVAALLVGVLSIGFLSKTHQCRNCDHKW